MAQTEALGKKNKIKYLLFIIVVISIVVVGVIFVVNNLNSENYNFSTDGYALLLSNESNKAQSYSFSNGSKYNYRKFNNKVSFKSDQGNISIDDASMIHYSDGSLLSLKNIVGIDISKIDNKIVFYYDIYKNTIINHKDGSYYVTDKNNENIVFDELLLRLDTDKFLLAGNDIKLLLSTNDIVDFGKYVYFEYSDGSIVKLYNNEKYYQTISNNAKIVVNETSINLADETISKEGKAYITLTNLVIDKDGNIDIIVDNNKETLGLIESKSSSTNTQGSSGNTTTNNGGGNISVIDPNAENQAQEQEKEQEQEEIVDDTVPTKQPVYKVTNMAISPIQLDARIEITDEDAVLISPTYITVVENSTYKTVYESQTELHDSFANISANGLNPDTEYTILARAKYVIEDVEYEKTFVSKIFRTESLGVSIEKNYATSNSLTIGIEKENYSKVTSVTVGVFSTSNTIIDYTTVQLSGLSNFEVTFDNLESNTEYYVRLYDVLCQGISVDNLIVQTLDLNTLKKAPSIEKLEYEINKKSASFTLKASGINDPNYGIKSYRYEVYDSRQDMQNEEPLVTYNKDKLEEVTMYVDDSKILRGVAYTYRLVLEFFDNEKIIEYSKDLGTTMQIDGVQFPNVRFIESEDTGVTWEQINGVIEIEDTGSAITTNQYKIIYKNSIDAYDVMRKTIDTTTNAIPINVNGLRANETYTFQVYTSVNLQDGNSTANDTYIGSVFVQTKSPKSLVANFVNNNDMASAFSVNFSLASKPMEDSTLEASTLNGLTFTMYEGTTTSGKEAAKVKVSDLNSEDYVSTIKNIYYDSSALITPEFFSKRNLDFTAKTYTLVVDNAYDYTKYKNEIPIENNTFEVTINAYVPDIPDDPSKGVGTTKILNKNATAFGLEYNDNLDPNTIVGYNIIANYRNESKYQGFIKYSMHIRKPGTSDFIKLDNLDKIVQFNSDGTLPSSVIELGSGTLADLDQDMLRRGNEYYISYEAHLDTDGDGTVDLIYPNDIDSEVTLTSDKLKPQKESSKFYMYPSSSTSNSATWKYKYVDIDNAIANKKLFSYVGTSTTASSTPAIEKNNEYQEVEFKNLVSDNIYTVKKAEKLLKCENEVYSNLNSQYLYKKIDSLNLSFRTEVDSNKLTLAINNYEENMDMVDKIVSADVIIIPEDIVERERLGSKTITNQQFTNGSIFIDYFDISNYLSVALNVDLKIYYDSGNSGFDVTNQYKAIQNMGIESTNNYYILDGKKLMQTSSINNSMFTVLLNLSENKISVTNYNAKSLDIDYEIDSNGISYSGNYITLKGLNEQTIHSENTARFDLIVPGISLINSNGKLNIESLLTGVEIKAKLIKKASATVVNDNIYMELYQTDSVGGNAEKIGEDIVFKTSDFDNPLLVTDLLPSTNYYVKFYTYIQGIDEKLYLYDIEQQVTGASYRFYTLTDVGIDDVSLSLISESYNQKYLKISYSLGTVVGFNRIEYKLYRLDEDTFVDSGIVIPNSINFSPVMNINVDAYPGSNPTISWGQMYKLVIKPIGRYESNGQMKEMELGTVTKEIKLKDFEDSYIGLSGSKTKDSMTYRISFKDPDHLIQNDSYVARLVDSQYNIVAERTGLTSDVNITYTFNSDTPYLYNGNITYLVDGEDYKLIVITNLDKNNTTRDLINYSKEKTIKFGDSTNLGLVTASSSLSGPKFIDIVFSESYEISRLTKITYTVSSVRTGEFVFSKTEDFTARYNETGDVYYFTINCTNAANFTEDEMYAITMNFYEGNEIKLQEEVNYYFGG